MQAAAEATAKSSNFHLMDQYQFGGFSGYAAAMDSDAAEALKTMAGVTGVEPNRKVPVPDGFAPPSQRIEPARAGVRFSVVHLAEGSGLGPGTPSHLRAVGSVLITCPNLGRCVTRLHSFSGPLVE